MSPVRDVWPLRTIDSTLFIFISNGVDFLLFPEDNIPMATIKIYSTPVCVYCKMAKDYFAKNGLTYTEFNVAEDEVAREKMVNKSHQLGVPVIDIDGDIYVGFDKRSIAKALNLPA